MSDPGPLSPCDAPASHSTVERSAALPASTVLDALALQKLRDLDPTGAGKLMERLAAAFDRLVERLLPQLQAALAADDAAGIREVAHTLKSSSASIGAIKLSALCAEMELLAKQGQTAGMHEEVTAVITESTAALAALKDALVSSP
jgi:HPt (histidine-containing phosphotransfer) domain-containing protein